MSKDRIEIADDKAERLVEAELSTCLRGVIKLNHEDEDFPLNLQIFRLLYQQTDPDYRMALWNRLALWGHNLDSPVITEEERQFITALADASRNSFNPVRTNVNKPFTTDRLRLRPHNGDEDHDLYYQHLKEDGDFSLFTTMKYSKANVRKFGFQMPYFFVVEEKKTGNMVGYAGLRWESTAGRHTGVMECEYYIFKPYREQGYASEAMTALCRRAFAGKLFEMQETNYQFIYRKKSAKPHVIRATVRADNVPSQRLIQRCGFRHMGTLQRHFWVENRYAVNCEVYECSKSDLQYTQHSI